MTNQDAQSLAVSMGLLPEEYEAIHARIGRIPNPIELAVCAGMWSEHCSYKSTRHLLATLPCAGERVLAGPGSHAGVVDVGDGWAVAFKIESHNHPSAVEPYQGAATGIGGILRDVIAQGARPCAVMDFLCFGNQQSKDSRRIARGVVAGVASYGNAMGIANVGGRTHYDSVYDGNPLVNALVAGLVRPSELRTAYVKEAGSVLIIVGATTGRDGIFGAAFASEALGSESQHATRRAHIQIGDPFAGKLLMEAVLRFGPSQGLLATQDLGASGIACACFEMAALSNAGLEVHLDHVPLREPGLSALEILLSESQERFALAVSPEHVALALAHFQQHGVHAAAIGQFTKTGRVQVYHRGELCIDLEAKLVAGGAPRSSWPVAASCPKAPKVPALSSPDTKNFSTYLLSALSQCGDLEPLYSHFDQTVGNRTVRGPGQGPAAVLRLPNSQQGFALTLTGRGELCAANPYLGTQSALAEAVRRLASTGAELVAITNGLNFASPRDPVEYRRIEEVITGLGDGLRVLGVPVTGGNVSLYNESPKGAIPPTPMIGAIGTISDVTCVPSFRLRTGQRLFLLGQLQDVPCASLYSTLRWGQIVGDPIVDLQAEQRLAALLRQAIAMRLCAVAQPVTRGGLLTSIARLCVRSEVGAELSLQHAGRADFLWFGEYPAQVLIASAESCIKQLTSLVAQHGVPIWPLGKVQGEKLHVQGLLQVELHSLISAYRPHPKAQDAV